MTHAKQDHQDRNENQTPLQPKELGLVQPMSTENLKRKSGFGVNHAMVCEPTTFANNSWEKQNGRVG